MDVLHTEGITLVGRNTLVGFTIKYIFSLNYVYKNKWEDKF